MTGRENIALNGSILGLPRKEIADVTDEIIDFSGLGDFINDPVKHYSSGMYVRLGFSVAVHMKPDVLLVDEVLAVGDEEFQRKCFDHLYALRRSGRTIIVVSHGLGQLEGLCDEIAWLEHGVMQEHGPAVDTIAVLPAQGQRRRVGAQPHGRGGARRGRRRASGPATRPCASPTPRSSIPTGNADQPRGDGHDLRGAARHHGRRVRRSARTCASPCSTTRARSSTMVSNHRWGVDFGTIEGDHVVEHGAHRQPAPARAGTACTSTCSTTPARACSTPGTTRSSSPCAARAARSARASCELPVEITFD